MGEPSSRRPLHVLIAIALGAVLLSGVWFASGQGGPPTGPADTASSGADAASADATGQPGATGSAAGDPQAPGAPQPPGSSQPPVTGPGDSPPAPSGTAPKPAAPGSELTRVDTPPERTLWALSPDSYDAGQEIAVRFEPYGTGPDSFGRSIVARVISTTPQDPSARVPELAERNVIFIVDTAEIATGGTWEGTAITRVQDDRLVLALRDARLIKSE